MTKITVLQTDNRSFLTYVQMTQQVNKKMCEYLQNKSLNYNHRYIELEPRYVEHMHATTSKIFFVNDYLQDPNNKDDILIFLDTDAWIHNPNHVNDIIKHLINDDSKQGCFSRDPYKDKNTYINSGSFIIKVNEYTKKMYKEIIENLKNDNSYVYKFPHDQYYISNYVYEHRNEFMIFVPNIINTPQGMVIKHNWQKNQTMFHELGHILRNNNIIDEYVFDVDKHLDDAPFPNTDPNANQFFN
jgi:hypothetical protein